MNIIAAVDKNWAIGCRGRLLVSIPQDKKFFREKTFGKTVVMGRKTFEDLPGGKALEGRRNIVLSNDSAFSPENALVLRSVEDCFNYFKNENIADEEIFIIGGESIYIQFLPYCDTSYITYIDNAYKADKYLAGIDKEAEWKLIQESTEKNYLKHKYFFRLYKRAKY